MGRAKREEQFREDEVAIVHCVQRCVRRAFLAGVDVVSGKNFEFRREWIRRRMEALASVFACDVLSYAILSNHMHLILRSRPDVVKQWSDEMVALRWLKAFPGRRIEEHLGEPTESDVQALVADKMRMAEIRKRLSNISWFMRALSEPIARMANRQDQVTGRFWEGRFKAQKITDEAGLLACAMYVDLNPVRAAMAETPDDSVHTSAYDRIEGAKGRQVDAMAFDLKPAAQDEVAVDQKSKTTAELKQKKANRRSNPTGKKIRRDEWLSPLTLDDSKLSSDPQVSATDIRASDKGFLNVSLRDYLRLLRWTAKQTRPGENRRVPPSLADVVSRLGIDVSMWRDLVWNFKRYFGRSSCAGTPTSMSQHATSSGRSWTQGQRAVAECFAPAS